MTATCAACGAEQAEGKRFCADCGAPMAVVCPSCGAEAIPGKPFCADCGTALAGTPAAAAPAPAAVAPTAPVAERRLTSILFGDLVGSTTIAESRDPEDVRELLSKYFAMAQKVVGRYGGTIEKFIGDAVMAVWGVPVAQEDDAERAVRAGLDLVAEIRVLAAEVGVAELDMRVGILTGEVAVTIGATNEGMVAGDAVNTAARIQSAAEPGAVWVDDTTRSLTSAAVTYLDAGEHLLKGKSEPVHLFRAGQVVAAVGGAQRFDGLQADFVGRDHDLRLVKELFHGAVAERRPRLVAVTGLAGVGKSRLGWELEKYIDGISEDVFWHRSRVLSYGDGVSFWAVAEMVRSRLGISEGDGPELEAEKLLAWLEAAVADAEERTWLRARLGVLLGIGASSDDPSGFERNDLFRAWTTFFERVSGGRGAGVVMVIDDMQHADTDLLDFLEHLLDSARFGLFVFTMARPELHEARPSWGTGRRATTVHLEPLDPGAMGQIVADLVDGLPDPARDALIGSAEGIPLYALEMVRMLIDRGAVVAQGGRYVLASDADERVDLSTLDAPPSLHALIAARLDRLTPEQRQLVQDAAVHGLTFSRAGIETVTEVVDLDRVLDELVRKDVLEPHRDRFVAERGQYRFSQALLRTVAYETLSRRDRKARHLQVARYLESSDDSDELAAVNARHYLDAIESVPSDPDVGELVAKAVGQLERAARRAELMGSPDEALRHFLAALACEPADLDRARLHEGAAFALQVMSRMDEGIEHASAARTLYESLGRPVEAGRAVACIGELLYLSGRSSEALAVLLPVYEAIDGVPASEEAALHLASVVARVLLNQGDLVRGEAANSRAAELAEARADWGRVVTHLTFQAITWQERGRATGATALLYAAVDLARREHLSRELIRGLVNLSALLKSRDLAAAQALCREALSVSLQSGYRDLRRPVLINLVLSSWLAGEWDEVEEVHREHLDVVAPFPVDHQFLQAVVATIRIARGQPVDLDLVVDLGTDSGDEYGRAWMASIRAREQGDAATAAGELARAVEGSFERGGFTDDFGILWPMAVDAKLRIGDTLEAERLVRYAADVPVGTLPPLISAHLPRLRALVAGATGADPAAVDADLELAVLELRAFGTPFYLARALLERATLLAGIGDVDAAGALRGEAATILQGLGAQHWLEQDATGPVGPW